MKRDTIEDNDGLFRKKQKLEDAGQSDDEFDDLEDTVQVKKKHAKVTDSDTYLDTVNRKILNFDLPLVCSASLATTNIYICLTCNKYLQGASESSPAYLHAIDTGHHVFINAQTSKFIILPEQLILSDTRAQDLHDIQLLLNPKFTKEMISSLDTKPRQSKTLNKETYDVGYIPLLNDYMSDISTSKITSQEGDPTLSHNALYYSLAHVPVIRDALLLYTQSETTPLTNQFSNLTKKIWSPYLFKNFTSSFAMENYLISCNLPLKINNNLRFFYSWIINSLIKENKKIFKDAFTGKLETNGKEVKFVNVSIKLPQESVFKSSISSSIEQYDLVKLIRDKKFKIIKHPKYLVIYIDRTNDMKIEGIEKQLNMNIVKFDPDLLQLDGNIEYQLISNITYDNKVYVLDKSRTRWVEFDSMSVKEVEKDLLFISNCELQIWELK